MRTAPIALTLLPLLFAGCPAGGGFDFTLRLNAAGDEALADELSALTVEVRPPDGDPTTFTFDPFDADEPIELVGVPAGEGVVFVVEGALGDGGTRFARGVSAPVDLPGAGETWVLFHRVDGFVPLEAGGDTARLGHAVIATGGAAVVIGGEDGEGGYGPISALVRTEQQGYALEDVDDGPEASGFMATRINGGDLEGQLFLGGGADELDNFAGIRDDFQLWDPQQQEYTASGRLYNPRHHGVALSLGGGGEGALVMTGGAYSYDAGSIGFLDWLDVLDPATEDEYAVSLGHLLWLHAPVGVDSETTLLCGGYVSHPIDGLLPSGDCEIYTLGDDDAVVVDDVLHQPRAGHTAVHLGGDPARVLLVGGTSAELGFTLPSLGEPNDVLANADLVELSGPDGVRALGAGPIDMVHPRVHPVAVWLPDSQRVLVCGGHDGDAPRADCEFFDPATSSFEEAPGTTLPAAVSLARAARLDDGSVLVVGGDAGDMTPASMAAIFLP